MTRVMKDPPATPGRELATMRNRLRRFFDEPFGSFLDPAMSMERRLPAFAWTPAVEAAESAADYLLTAELPGISPEDVEVSVAEGVLTLKGKKQEEWRSEDKERTYHLWEREYGEFARTFRFPVEIEEAKVTADFTNGVLTVRVPKAKDARPAARTVPIGKK